MILGNVDLSKQRIIVAEIGNNHEGNFDVACDLVRKAAECGVDAVKFQTFRAEHYVSQSNTARYNRLKSFELNFSQFEYLASLTHSLGLLFISTPFDLSSATFLEKIVDCYKISSGDNTFYPLLAQVAKTGKPLILSTGLSDLSQISRAIDFVEKEWDQCNIPGQMAILHCVSCYPVPPEQINLSAISILLKQFNCIVGFSDHVQGIEAAVLAVALGARIIEKHFTLDKFYSDFRDHQLSADPLEMKELVKRIRLASAMIGEPKKIVQPCEEGLDKEFRRSIVAGKDMLKGHKIDWQDITWIRPPGGLAPGNEHLLLGKALKRDIRFGEQLLISDVE